jgi:hypothetical protein
VLEVGFFEASGIERQGPNPYLPGISYGEIVEAICWCHAAGGDYSAGNFQIYDTAINTILTQGFTKLVSDLSYPQLRRGAIEAILALGTKAEHFIPELISRASAREVLLTFPTTKLLEACEQFLSGPAVSPMAIESCLIISERIRANHRTEDKEKDLSFVIEQYPEAPWLRYILGQVWRESADSEWVRTVLCQNPDSQVLAEIRTEVEQADLFAIDLPLRWSSANLAEILRNREMRVLDERPVAILVYPEADHNGAFGMHNPMLETLTQAGYRVMLYDEAGRRGVMHALKSAGSIPQLMTPKEAELIVLAAHSSKTEMTFGLGGAAESKVTVADLDLLLQSEASRALKPGGQVILIACSTGAGRESADNIANMWRKVFSQAKRDGIWSSEVPDNIRGIELCENGELLNVLFMKGPVYRP